MQVYRSSGGRKWFVTNSTALKVCQEMIHRGAREFVLDLVNCQGWIRRSWVRLLGSRFGFGSWAGSLSVVNLNERNAESLSNLGLDQLLMSE